MPELMTTSSASLHELTREADRGALYAILDAVDEPRVPAKLRELRPARAASLYRGAAADDLAALAPYLVRVDADLLEWIAATLWTDAWGIFAVSGAGFDAMRTHFRKFLLVDAPDGDSWYFRFYDPRVLARFLPTCDVVQLSELFGPIDWFAWTDIESYGVTIARRDWHDQSAQPKPRITFRHA
jgi:hypothetical protein